MKAYSLDAIGRIEYRDVPMPECKPGWSIVKVKAAGICSSDIPRIFTKGTYHFPTIPGHEFSGMVMSVADEKDAHLVGKRVGIFPLIPCRKCEFCGRGQYELCTDYDYLGSRRDGGFAEYVAVPVWNLIELGENVSLIDAAMMEPLAVSLHAINRLDIYPGDEVAVVGTGMIAFGAAQWALTKGAKTVTVLGRSEKKRAIAKAIGSIAYETYGTCDRLFDRLLEAVGSGEAIDHSINLVKPGGMVVLMGNPEGDIQLSQNTYWRILRKQLTLKGTWNSSYENGRPCDWEVVRDNLSRKTVNVESLVSHVFPQNRLSDALELMRSHKEPYCKVMTIWNEE